jgi:septum formation protein
MLILASASPRRRELLALLTKDFKICPASIPEKLYLYQTPGAYALMTASAKAHQVSLEHPEVVLGADTVVCKGAQVFGKPGDVAANIAMLRALAGGWHSVLTGVALYQRGRLLERTLVKTRVLFDSALDDELIAYANSSEGLDKAGGYGIQGMAGKFVAALDGCYYNVVGLPLTATARLLNQNL